MQIRQFYEDPPMKIVIGDKVYNLVEINNNGIWFLDQINRRHVFISASQITKSLEAECKIVGYDKEPS